MSLADTDPAEYVAAFEARSHRVDTPCGKGTMAWRIWGDSGSGRRPVVLGHGAQGAWSHWIRNIDALAAGRMVIAADMPGHGDSAMPEAADHRAISRAIAEGLHLILGDANPAEMVGFSFGGVAFAHFAAWFPEKVARLVLVGTGGLDTPHGHVRIGRVGGLAGEERRAAIKANLLGLMLQNEDSVDDLAMHLLIANAARTRLERAQDFVMPDRLVRILPEVSVPVAAIWGEFDLPHPDPALQEAVIRRFHPRCDFRVVAGAGHWVMYERAEAFNRELLAILDGGAP